MESGLVISCRFAKWKACIGFFTCSPSAQSIAVQSFGVFHIPVVHVEHMCTFTPPLNTKGTRQADRPAPVEAEPSAVGHSLSDLVC